MSGLTDADRKALARIIETTIGLGVPDAPGCHLCGRDIPCPTHVGAGAVFNIAPTVEAIVVRAVKEALEDAAELVGQFDPTDNYHGSDYQEPGYYSALSRAEALLLGHISDWRDLGPAARAT